MEDERTEEELELETLEVETLLVEADIKVEPEAEIKAEIPKVEGLAVIRARKQAHQLNLRGGK